MQYDVFISYSSKDSATAQAICHELEDNHIRCWMAPRDIPVGSKYASVITEAIKSCKAVVLVFSERSAMSPWVESEINIAFSNRKPIIPYKIDKAHVEDYSEFYLMLNNRHWIEAYPDFKTRFAELVDVVSKIVNPHQRGEEEKGEDSPSLPTPNPIKRWIWPAFVCVVAALAIIFWPKNSSDDTFVKMEKELLSYSIVRGYVSNFLVPIVDYMKEKEPTSHLYVHIPTRVVKPIESIDYITKALSLDSITQVTLSTCSPRGTTIFKIYSSTNKHLNNKYLDFAHCTNTFLMIANKKKESNAYKDIELDSLVEEYADIFMGQVYKELKADSTYVTFLR